jgi:hypothetical protein
MIITTDHVQSLFSLPWHFLMGVDGGFIKKMTILVLKTMVLGMKPPNQCLEPWHFWRLPACPFVASCMPSRCKRRWVPWFRGKTSFAVSIDQLQRLSAAKTCSQTWPNSTEAFTGAWSFTSARAGAEWPAAIFFAGSPTDLPQGLPRGHSLGLNMDQVIIEHGYVWEWVYP